MCKNHQNYRYCRLLGARKKRLLDLYIGTVEVVSSHLLADNLSLMHISLKKMPPYTCSFVYSIAKLILLHKHSTHPYQANTIVLAIISALKLVKSHLSSTPIAEVGQFGYVICC